MGVQPNIKGLLFSYSWKALISKIAPFLTEAQPNHSCMTGAHWYDAYGHDITVITPMILLLWYNAYDMTPMIWAYDMSLWQYDAYYGITTDGITPMTWRLWYYTYDMMPMVLRLWHDAYELWHGARISNVPPLLPGFKLRSDRVLL